MSGDQLLKGWHVRHHHCGCQQHLIASSSPLLLLCELVAVTHQRAISLKTSPTQMMDSQKVLFPVQSHIHQGTSLTVYPVSPELQQPYLGSALGLPHCPFPLSSLLTPHYANQLSLSFPCSHECRDSLLPGVSLLWWTKASKKSGQQGTQPPFSLAGLVSAQWLQSRGEARPSSDQNEANSCQVP